MLEEDVAACNKAMASPQQNNYSSIPQQQQQQLPQTQATAAGNGGASQSMAPTAPDNTSAPAPAAADGANPGYYSAESIQQAVAATAALMETNGGSFGGGGSFIQQSVQPGGVNTQVVPPTAAAPTIPAQYLAMGASASAAAPDPTILATNPNEQLMALMAATAARQQTKAQQQQPNPTIVTAATAADQQQGFGLADQGRVIAAGIGFGDTMAPQTAQQMRQVQYERGSHVMESTTATMKDSEAPAPAAVVGGQQPTYVNAKQYKRILKRREERALIEEMYSIKRQRLQEQKASLPVNGLSEIDSSSGKRNQHESRRRHAKKRPRHKTGRFLTKTELVEYSKEHPEEDPKRLKDNGGEQKMEKSKYRQV